MKYDFQWKAILVGLLFLLAGGVRLVGILQAKSWLEKDAVMDKAELVAQRSSSGTTFRLDVSYHWEHEGQTWTGHEFSVDGTLVESSRTVLEDKATPWLHSKHIKCKMNPRKPEQAVLMPANNLDTQIVMVVLGILLLLWGAVWPVWVVRRSQRAEIHLRFPAEGYSMVGIALIFGVIMGGMIFEELSARQQARTWIETPCMVLESRVVWVKNEFRPLIRYSWDVNGRNHEGQTSSASTFHGSILDVEKLVAQFPVGKPSTCWVNPNSPAQAVLERDPPLRGWIWWLAFAAMIGACLRRFALCWKQWSVSRSTHGLTDIPGLSDAELAEESGQTPEVKNQKSGFTREAFLHFFAELPLLKGLLWVIFPCLAVLLWLLPVARREMEYGLWFSLSELGCIFAGAILLTALLSLTRRLWKS
jgi:hypothetical protein